MSAIAALKGYRTQFLYSLFYILSHTTLSYKFRLEGEEDLDILDSQGNLLFAVQVKNLAEPITLSNLLAEQKTSFLKRFLNQYYTAIPVLVSFGAISQELKSWQKNKDSISQNEKKTIVKYKISEEQWKLIKSKTEFIEINENQILKDVLYLLKDKFPFIDPVPTADNILYWLQNTAENQVSITTNELFSKIEDIGLYLTQRIAVAEQYGLMLKPLHKVSVNKVNIDRLEEEFYYGTTARYEHILFGLDVLRENFINEIQAYFKQRNIVIIKGASGQGKSTLAYRYVYEFVPETRAYELIIQQDLIATQKSIQAIIGIASQIDTPVFFLIHVIPNTTEWVKIVNAFAHQKFVNFLVTIRNEDWFRASTIGIEFLHNEIELQLIKNEAEVIYNNLNEKKQILHFIDFEEAWIKIGNDVPMLEFVYSITQGDSLKNRLRQQVRQIDAEDCMSDSSMQSDFLRLISLADSFGAKIDISKSKAYTSQFIVEKFQREYLIKQSGDGKYILGLHPVRSETLISILFDEFVNYKKEFVLKCLPIIANEDVYLFLIQAFYRNFINSKEVIYILTEKPITNWTYYNGILKGLMWSGINEYIINNKTLLDECYDNYGDAWIWMVDLSHGNIIDMETILESFPSGEKMKKASKEINGKLSEKKEVYKHVIVFFNNVNFPTRQPLTSLDWNSFGETLFWLKNIPNQAPAVITIPEKELDTVFKTLDLDGLSKLMLGMFYYSEYYNSVRLKLSHHFVKRLQHQFNIIQFKNEEDITLHYIIEILKSGVDLSYNDLSVKIIDLLRDAFPDKQKFNTQGHGHRLQLVALSHDDTQKGISIKNLPLIEWVNINASSHRLYEFSKRPKDWQEFQKILSTWEDNINELITEFNTSFEQYFKTNSTNDYQSLIPILKNSSFAYSNTIKEPQSISDHFGIYFDAKRAANKLIKNDTVDQLKTKYALFFKSQRDFQTAIEHFISQSGKAFSSKMENLINSNKKYDDDFEYHSQINLFDAIKKLSIYEEQKQLVLKKFGFSSLSKINTDKLLSTAVLWKSFLIDNKAKNINNILPYHKVDQLKKDFEKRIIKGCKNISKRTGFDIKYLNNNLTNYKPLFLIDCTNPAITLIVWKEVYNLIKESVGYVDNTSLKFLMLQVCFSNFYLVQLTNGRTINNQWNVLPLYLFRNTNFEDLKTYQTVAKTIDKKIQDNLTLENWNEILPKINEIQKLSQAFIQMRSLAEHIYDLKFFEGASLEDIGSSIFKEHVQTMGLEIQKSFQYVLDSLRDLLFMFPFNKEEYSNNELEQEYWNALIAIKNSLFPTDKDDEENYQVRLDISSTGNWIEKLKPCTEHWGVFTLLLYGKYIKLYENNFKENSTRI